MLLKFNFWFEYNNEFIWFRYVIQMYCIVTSYQGEILGSKVAIAPLLNTRVFPGHLCPLTTYFCTIPDPKSWICTWAMIKNSIKNANRVDIPANKIPLLGFQ